jgi:cobyrinic acid a,c-diamide synthase
MYDHSRHIQLKQKAIAPSTRMEFLGIVCDSEKLTLEISESRLKEILSVVVEWVNK